VEVIVVVVLARLDLGLLQRLELPGVARVMRQRNIVMLAMFAVAGILALPLFVLVMGKGIQLFHFGFAVTRICSLVLLILGIYLATDLCRLLPGVSRKARVGPGEGGKMWVNAAACAIMCISLAVSVERAYKKARGDLDANWEMPDAADQHDYRSRFADLVRELSSAKYDGAPVIGTFDYQVYCWWLTFRNGYALMPDPFYTTITDGEIEQRMILMCRLLGMNADQFWALISQVNPDVLWLAHWKYNVSNGYTLRPLEDYPSEAIPAIQRTSIATMERLLYVIPNSEKRRLMAEFDAPAPAGAVPRLDLIVLTNGPEYRGFAPPAGEYQKTYENTMFRVFERIPGKGQAN